MITENSLKLWSTVNKESAFIGYLWVRVFFWPANKIREKDIERNLYQFQPQIRLFSLNHTKFLNLITILFMSFLLPSLQKLLGHLNVVGQDLM